MLLAIFPRTAWGPTASPDNTAYGMRRRVSLRTEDRIVIAASVARDTQPTSMARTTVEKALVRVTVEGASARPLVLTAVKL